MDRSFRIAVVLSAYDRMTTVVAQAASASSARLQALQDNARKTFGKGGALFTAGIATAAALKTTVDAFANLEESQNKLKSTMMGPGGFLDEKKFKAISGLAVQLGNDLKGNSADFFTMINKQMQLGVSTESILNGVGKSTAYLAIATNQGYEAAAEVSSKLKEATGIADGDMNAFLDTIARTYNLGVDTGEMGMAFARSAGALKTLNLQGLQASQSIAPLYAMLSKTGASGEQIGTNMSTVFASMMDSGKMTKFNGALKEYGINASFVDSQSGQFKGVQNMLSQFDQLKTLNPQQLSNVVAAWLGPGADASFVKIFTNAGSKGYDAMVNKLTNQANLDAKVKQQNKGWTMQMEALGGTWENVKASFGESLMPVLKPLLSMLNKLAASIQVFINQHPDLFQFISTFVAVASAGLMIAGVIKIFQGIVMVMKILNITMMANPFVLFAAIAIAVVALIISKWSSISRFFSQLWDNIKTYFSNFWDWAVGMFKYLSPAYLIYENWGGITQFFSNIWARVTAIFKNGWSAVKSFFGMGDAEIGATVNKNLNVTGGGSLAGGLKPNAVSGNSSINYQPVINFTGNQQDATALTGMMKNNFDKQLQEHQAQKNRRAF